MSEEEKPTNLEQLLELIGKSAEDKEQVSLGEILRVAGNRSFGPLLLVAGIITLAPVIGDIPGVPTIMGTIVFLIAVQLFLRREHFWLPEWLLGRSVERSKFHKALEWLKSPARFIDRFLRPRLTVFTEGTAVYIVAGVCILIAAAMPVMEFVPFSANAAGVALTAFGLALIAHDGLLALIAFLFTVATAGMIAYNLI